MMIRDTFIVLMAILIGTGCGGSQVTAEFDSPQTVDQADTPEGRETEATPVRKEAKQLFKEAMQAYRPKAGRPRWNGPSNCSRMLCVDEDPAFGAAYFNIDRIYEDKGDLKKPLTTISKLRAKVKTLAPALPTTGVCS